MTVIAALRDGESMWLATDTVGVDGNDRVFQHRRKLCVVNLFEGKAALLGIAGRRGLQPHLIRAVQETGGPAPTTALDVWAQDVCDRWCRAARGGAAQLCDSEGNLDGAALLVYKGQAWQLTDGIADPITGWGIAIGSGGDLAQGCLATLAALGSDANMEPDESLGLAVEIAGRYDASCGGEPAVAVSHPNGTYWAASG